MNSSKQIAENHLSVTRRYFIGMGAAGAVAGAGAARVWAERGEINPLLAKAMKEVEYLTKDEDFKLYGRGNPKPYTLPAEKLREAGLTRETWKLEVIADPESDSDIERPLTIEAGTALDWAGLMELAKDKAIRFMNVITCTNNPNPCGMGLWEGVPLRDVVWMAGPKANIRRVFYYGFHNDDLAQRFQGSLSINRVLEDPPGEHPVILCYKLNGQWLSPKRGAPVRMIVPEAYGNRSVKWLKRIVLTNEYKTNDTYALWNNDVDSHLKTFARFIQTPERVRAGEAVPVTGLAQVGMSGLSEVQVCLLPRNAPRPSDDPYFSKADWKKADILPPPERWGGGLPEEDFPPIPLQFDPADDGKPLQWPMRYALAHWGFLLKMPPDAAGPYELLCRTIDGKGIAQPMPRPLPKSGRNAIQSARLRVEASDSASA